MTSLGLQLADLARWGEELTTSSLNAPGPLTLAIVFAAGLLTSLGPCSLSLLPITMAYMAGFPDHAGRPWQRSLSFAGGIVLSLVALGGASALLGSFYGQIPGFIPALVAVLAVVMGLNLLGLLSLPLPSGPDPERWRRYVPAALAPLATGAAFGLAASPCTTPVLAVLLAWTAQQGRPLIGMTLLTCFAAGQVVPLLLAGSAASSMQRLLDLRPLSRWIPPISGVVLVASGGLTLLAQWP
ncbi:cytochrome c biogenesis protein CcdA [Synechococcus sp. CS-602]|uniref:cytochrome c biogenesis CcdA family protein n=1 Tax=Synechococcaceae TaxID=1890426 RepID=UPI0008FF74D8|nr:MULTISPECIES: cytochrome c biogenesis protein CcdA [Synechococcaceae]MCT4363618.1 cytochrome c biogenesis protein CcdA [Candidatus Regnicoccus frigidus MAG-AL1]APD48564.1 cytochrome C biogenesis protein [Synechococcus sp. SynAce01]MCT0205375.1 cytochrome c biogenesis protein CcdA [Synechococcus sp. CS-602]MCT0246869.1 cytochrome c biogenesis protein CcdA [Synechococcus sp. CS-601]MCT4367307.1 cytochrome c biogenesis protein CcdA [Candidatus Regnicoccus frigidus MAG-AL2]